MRKFRAEKYHLYILVSFIISMFIRIEAVPAANLSNDFYVATVALDKKSTPNSTFVLQKGLLQVLSKVSGKTEAEISNIPAVNQVLQKPENYLAKYSVQLSEISSSVEPDSSPQSTERLAVLTFIPKSIDSLVKNANLMVVNRNSQVVVVWIWGEDAQGRFILAESNMSQTANQYRQTIDRIAMSSGLKILYPLQDLEEQIVTSGALTDTSIDIDKLIKASKRYNTEMILVGYIPKAAVSSRWALINKDLNSSNFSPRAVEATQAITQAFDWLNKSLNNERKVSQSHQPNQNNQLSQFSSGTKENIVLRVNGINTFGKYNKLNEYFKNISMVEDIRVNKMGQDWLELSIHTKQGKDALTSFLNKDNRLVKENAYDASILADNSNQLNQWDQSGQSLIYGWYSEL